MKPMIILPPNAVSKEDVEKLNENGICTVICKNPAALKFVDPIPVVSSRTQIEYAAIKLSRKLLNGIGYDNSGYLTKKSITDLYCMILIEGSPLDEYGTKEEQEERVYDCQKKEELRRLARLDAKIEHEKRKAEKAKLKSENDTRAHQSK